VGKTDKGIGRLTLAVEPESCSGEVVDSVVVTKTKIIISGGKRRLFFLFFY